MEIRTVVDLSSRTFRSVFPWDDDFDEPDKMPPSNIEILFGQAYSTNFGVSHIHDSRHSKLKFIRAKYDRKGNLTFSTMDIFGGVEYEIYGRNESNKTWMAVDVNYKDELEDEEEQLQADDDELNSGDMLKEKTGRSTVDPEATGEELAALLAALMEADSKPNPYSKPSLPNARPMGTMLRFETTGDEKFRVGNVIQYQGKKYKVLGRSRTAQGGNVSWTCKEVT